MSPAALILQLLIRHGAQHKHVQSQHHHHASYPFWSGALFNRGRNKADKVDIDLSHSNLAPGLLCADGQYRQISEVAAKDEFLNIKNVSRDDMMAAHRVPPQMMGIMPNNVGGFGDVEKASCVFVRNELMPLQKRLQELNRWLKDEIIRFATYSL